MARRSRLLVPGVLYHVIVRGNHRRKTFLNDSDYQAYLERFGRYRKCLGVIVYAYRLVPNHIHLWSRHGDGEFFDFWFRGAAEVRREVAKGSEGIGR
jgi:putative transposase